MADETTTQTTTTTADAGKTENKPAATTTAADDKGGDDLEALKRHNKALLTELTNKKTELADFKGKYETLQSEKEAREADELKKKGEYKELLDKSEAKIQSFQKQVMKAQLQAFAIEQGIIDRDLIDVIPTENIKISVVGDSIQVAGAEEAVKAYKASKPHLFKAAEVAAAAAAAATTTTTPAAKPTGAAITDPNAAGNTTNALANGVKPGSKEHQTLEQSYLAKYR